MVTDRLARALVHPPLPSWVLSPRNQGTAPAALLRGNLFLKPDSFYQQLSCLPPLAAVGLPKPGPHIQGGLIASSLQFSWLLRSRPGRKA